MISSYLLDTNVISEVHRSRRDERVVRFLESISGQEAFLSVLTVGELRRGAEKRRRTDPVQAGLLDIWIDQVEFAYAERVLPIDQPVARAWGELTAARQVSTVDGLIAATALVRGLTLVTRNTRDFKDMGLNVIDPWLPLPEGQRKKR